MSPAIPSPSHVILECVCGQIVIGSYWNRDERWSYRAPPYLPYGCLHYCTAAVDGS